MKNILQLLVNLLAWWHLSFSAFLGILWYGKLPKVSLYHWTNKSTLYTTKDMYNDINCQVISVDDVPTKIKQKIIEKYIDSLYENDIFASNIQSIDIPIFDGKEIVGTQGIYEILNQVKEQQL